MSRLRSSITVATPASQGQVIQSGFAAVLFGNHVVNFVGKKREVVRQKTVLTTMTGADFDFTA
jgi:hypothetical protein